MYKYLKEKTKENKQNRHTVKTKKKNKKKADEQCKLSIIVKIL